MILTYLYDLDELNKMGDIIILNIKDYSFSLPKMYSISEAKELISKYQDKKFIININPLYHNSELDKLKYLINELKDAYGFLFQDLGLVKYFKEFNILSKAIYAPETFITNEIDKEYFKQAGINNLLLSREITLNDINLIVKNKENTKYFYSSFGYQMMFYSYRKHFSNFVNEYNLNLDLNNKFNISIKEDTRNELYKTIEDSRGFRIYRDKVFNAYNDIKDIDIDYLILDRIFIDDNMYFDTINLYKGLLSYNEYMKKYHDKVDSGYLYKEIGLLKGE